MGRLSWLFVVIAMMLAGGVTAKADPDLSLSAFANDPAAPACDTTIDPQFGIAPISAVPSSKVTPDWHKIFLRLKILRYPASSPSERRIAGLDYSHLYDDHIFIFHFPENEIVFDLQRAMTSGVPRNSRLREVVDCSYMSSKEIVLHAPFFAMNSAGTPVSATTILHVLRRYYVPSERVPRESAVVSEPSKPQSLVIVPDSRTGAPQIWAQNYYPWVDASRSRDVKAGEAVFAVDRATCEPDGNFLLGTIGNLANDQAPGSVIRGEMIALNNYYGASGNPTDRKAVTESVNDRAYWCIPKREFCYQRVAFGDFGVRAKKGELAAFASSKIFSMEDGLLAALQAAIVGTCAVRLTQERKY